MRANGAHIVGLSYGGGVPGLRNRRILPRIRHGADVFAQAGFPVRSANWDSVGGRWGIRYRHPEFAGRKCVDLPLCGPPRGEAVASGWEKCVIFDVVCTSFASVPAKWGEQTKNM